MYQVTKREASDVLFMYTNVRNTESGLFFHVLLLDYAYEYFSSNYGIVFFCITSSDLFTLNFEEKHTNSKQCSLTYTQNRSRLVALVCRNFILLFVHRQNAFLFETY